MNTSPYVDAQFAARAAEHALSVEAARGIDAALQTYAQNLTRALRQLPNSPATAMQRAAMQRSLVIVQMQHKQLLAELTRAVQTGRDVAFGKILDIHNAATVKIAETEGIAGHLLGAVVAPNLTMAGVWESLGTGAKTWKTLLTGYVGDAAIDASKIISTALLEGMSPDELARRLRPYVTGAESFQDAFKSAGTITDKLLNDPLRTGAARRLRYNADRIAFSEVHNARGEAELQAFAADPWVKAVRWTLSPNRGTQITPDACDVLARTNYYGLGPGVYPLSSVPVSPHPFDRCEREPVARGSKEMHHPKPNPRRLAHAKPSFGPAMKSATRAELLRAAEVAERAMTANVESGGAARMMTLSEQGRLTASASVEEFASGSAGEPVIGTIQEAPAALKKKHDLIAWYRLQGETTAEIDARLTKLGFKLRADDFTFNLKWYGTEKQPAHILLQPLMKNVPLIVPPPIVTPPIVTPPIVTTPTVARSVEEMRTQILRAHALADPSIQPLVQQRESALARHSEQENLQGTLRVKRNDIEYARAETLYDEARAGGYVPEKFDFTGNLVSLEARQATSFSDLNWSEKQKWLEKAEEKLITEHEYTQTLIRLAANQAEIDKAWAMYVKTGEELNARRDALRATIHEILRTPGVARVEVSPMLGKKLIGPRAKTVQEALRFLKAVVPDSVNPIRVVYKPKPGRAQHTFGKIHISAEAKPGTIVHEIMHEYEQVQPGWLRRAIAFRTKRTIGESTVQLKKLYPGYRYKNDEITLKDKWVTGGSSPAYTGKVYESNHATEVITTGMEWLYNDPVAFARDDPEFFEFIINLLRGTP